MDSFTVNFTSPEVQLFTNLTSQDNRFDLSLMGGVLCFNLLVGLPTHSYVLWLIVTGRGAALEFFNFNLTVCEIIYFLNSLVYILSLWFPNLTILFEYLQGIVITCCPLFQSLISVERYLAVIHPVTFLKFKPLRYRVICAVVVWVTSFGCSGVMITLFMASICIDVFFVFILAQIFLLVSIQLFCCLAVLRALKQSAPGERGREREEENNTKRRAFHLILITAVVIIIMFVPYTVTGLLSVLTQVSHITVGYITSYACFSLGAFVHPVLYLHRAGKLFCLHFS